MLGGGVGLCGSLEGGGRWVSLGRERERDVGEEEIAGKGDGGARDREG